MDRTPPYKLISEDEAISKGLTIEQWLQQHLDEGFTIRSKTHHPAVGIMYQLDLPEPELPEPEYNPEC